MIIKNVLKFVEMLNESMSVKAWKQKYHYHQMPEETKQRINDILSWYRKRGNEDVRNDLPLEGMSQRNVEEILGGLYNYAKMKEMLGDKNSYNLVYENDKVVVIAPKNPDAATHLARTFLPSSELSGENAPNSEELKGIDKNSQNYSPTWCIASSSADLAWEQYHLFEGELTYFFLMKEKKYHGLRFAMVLNYEKYDYFKNGKDSLRETIKEFREPSQESKKQHLERFDLFLKISDVNEKDLENAIRDYCKNTNEKPKNKEDLIGITKKSLEKKQDIKDDKLGVKIAKMSDVYTKYVLRFFNNPTPKTLERILKFDKRLELLRNWDKEINIDNNKVKKAISLILNYNYPNNDIHSKETKIALSNLNYWINQNEVKINGKAIDPRNPAVLKEIEKLVKADDGRFENCYDFLFYSSAEGIINVCSSMTFKYGSKAVVEVLEKSFNVIGRLEDYFKIMVSYLYKEGKGDIENVKEIINHSNACQTAFSRNLFTVLNMDVNVVKGNWDIQKMLNDYGKLIGVIPWFNEKNYKSLKRKFK